MAYLTHTLVIVVTKAVLHWTGNTDVWLAMTATYTWFLQLAHYIPTRYSMNFAADASLYEHPGLPNV